MDDTANNVFACGYCVPVGVMTSGQKSVCLGEMDETNEIKNTLPTHYSMCWQREL